MSFINGSQFAGSGSSAEYPPQRSQIENAQSDAMRWQPPSGDGFANTPIALPQGNSGSLMGGVASSDSGNVFGAILQNLTNAIAQIAAYLSGQSATGTSTGTGTTAAPQGENYFTNASASSTGDPHDAFDGTTGSGANVNDKWDNMRGHGDLLDSDSFRGGYRVSTTTTNPSQNGVTYNASATVATDGGATSVTMNRDGSYAVSEHGQNVALTQGQATQIGRDETVTLNADKSLTVTDTDRQGGTLTTTLSNNGNGVDVKANASNVDLGGYLVDRTQNAADPVALGGQPSSYGAGAPWVQPGAVPSYATQSFATRSSPFAYGSETEPLGAGEIEFA